MFWTSKDTAVRERVNKIPNPVTGTWQRVPPPMVVLPPLLSRSNDDLSSGGLGCSILTSVGDRGLLWVGCEWWRVGGKAVHSNGAWEHVKTLIVMIFQGFVDRAMIYPLVEVVAWCDTWKLEFRGFPCLAELGSTEIALVHALSLLQISFVHVLCVSIYIYIKKKKKIDRMFIYCIIYYIHQNH